MVFSRQALNRDVLEQSPLLQFRVFRLGFLQDGDVGVGIFPEGEKSWGWASLLRQPHFAHQLSKPWVGMQAVESEIGLQPHQPPITLVIGCVEPLTA